MMRLKKRITHFDVIYTIVVITFLVTILFITSNSVLAQYKTGSPAPDFTLYTVEKEQYQLDQFLNKQQHLILFFIDSEQNPTIDKLERLVNFFYDYQPRESYQVISIIKQSQDIDVILNRLDNLIEKTGIPLINLLDNEGKTIADYGIENYPSIILLRADLHVRKAYDRRFTSRQEDSFYQYLRFIFTSKKGKDNGNGCNGDVCPPPPGFE